MKQSLPIAFAAFLFTCLVTTAFSQTTYTFSTAGNWNAPSNWTGGVVPPDPLPSADFIVINADCTRTWYTTINGTMTVNAGRTLTISNSSESLTLINDGTLNNYGTIDCRSSQTLTNNSGRTITNFSGGILQINAGGILSNSGTLLNNSGGAVTILMGGYVSNRNGGIVTNNGTITSGWFWINESGSTLDNNLTINTAAVGAVTNQNGGIMNVNNGSTYNIYCTGTNAGTININTGGTLHIYSTLTSSGSLTSSGTLNNHNTLVNDGTIGSTLNIIGPGIIRGSGTHLGFFSNNATLAPGSAVNIPGCYHFQNGFTTTNRLSMDMNGATSCTQFDQIQVIGTMTKGGELSLKFGFTPAVGQMFQIITATSFTGNFAFFESTPSNIQFTESGGIVTITSVLPVELIRFSATPLEKTVRLDWTTATETNNQGFYVERSTDAAQWETLGFVKGQGNSTTEVSYSFLDEKPLLGLTYYRLQQVDFDGKATLSNMVQVTREGLPGKVLIYPNPVAVGIECTITSSEEVLSLRLLDAVGRQVAVLTNAQRLETQDLKPGIYWLEVQSAQGNIVEKLIVQ